MKEKLNLQTRADVARTLLDLIRPLKAHYSESKSWLEIGNVGVHYGEKTARMESFARIIWGLGPLFAGMDTLPEDIKAEAEEWRQHYIEGMVNGSDPENHEYWGCSYDFDQKIVEMAALVTSISLAPDKLWNPLTDKQKENLYNFFNQANSQEMHPNNWRYFRILINMTFRKLGLPFNQERLLSDRELIEGCYVGDGWYYDGHAGQVDYYIPFAMHFYALIFAETSKDVEPEYSKVLKDRASEFSHDIIYWFANNGNEIPYGRSLTYRFAHSSFFGAMAYAGVEGVGYGVMKNLTLRNLENWLARSIFDNGGVLTIGYHYPNIFMSERYNAAGSPYWAFKAFIILALGDDHPFWTATPEKFDYEPQKELPHSYMILTHEDDHVLAYATGQCAPKPQGYNEQKYCKFVYSNQFGFSIARGTTLLTGCFDSSLVATYSDEENYRMRSGLPEKFETSAISVKTNYKLLRDVNVKTVVIPCGAWHVRVHEIDTKQEINIADCGFSIEAEPFGTVIYGKPSGKLNPDINFKYTENGAYAVFPWGVSGIETVSDCKATVEDCFPNTNIMYNTSVLPTTAKTLAPGKHIIATCVFGDRTDKALEKAKDVPQVKICDGKITVKTQNKEICDTFLA